MTGEAAATGRPVLRVHAVGRIRQVPPLPCRARGLRRHAAAAGARRRRCPTGATRRCIRPTPSRARSSAAGSPGKTQGADAKSRCRQPTMSLCAGGTLSVPQLSLPARAWRIAEMALLYGAAPFAVDRAVHGTASRCSSRCCRCWPIILMFLVVDRTFSLRRELSRGFSLRQLVSILAVFAVGGGIVATYVVDVSPGAVPRISAQPTGRLPAHHAALSADVGGGAGARLPHVLLPPLRRAVRERVVAGHPAQRRAVRPRPHRHRHAARHLRHHGSPARCSPGAMR